MACIMTDFLTTTERSERMGRIRRVSQLEIHVRDFLEEQGYELELHSPEIISHPDIVVRDKNAIVAVNGCFWHRHDNCRLAARVSAEGSARPNRWNIGFPRQVKRDRFVISELLNAGWRVLVVWECAVSEKKAPAAIRADSLQEIVRWLESDEISGDIRRQPQPG